MIDRFLFRVGLPVLAIVVMDCSMARAQGGAPQKGREVLTVRSLTSASVVSGDSGAHDAKGRINSDEQLSLGYRPVTPIVDVQVGFSSGVRLNMDTRALQLMGHAAGARIGWAPGARTAVHLFEKFGYVPIYSLVPIFPAAADVLTDNPDVAIENPAELTAETLNFAVTKRGAYHSVTTIDASHQLTRSTSASLVYSYRRRTFENSTDPSLSSMNASGRIEHRINRFLRGHVGYGRRVGNYGGTRAAFPDSLDVAGVDGPTPRVPRPPAAIDDLDIGIDSRSLALGKNASLSFTTGSSFVTTGDVRTFVLTGASTFGYHVSKRQDIAVDVRRDVNLSDGFGEPFYSNSIALRTSVALGRRIQLSALSSYSAGHVGSPGEANGHSSITGSAEVGYNFSTRGRASVAYYVYRHELGSGVDVLETVPRYQRSHSVTGGLSFSLPILRDDHPRPRRVAPRR